MPLGRNISAGLASLVMLAGCLEAPPSMARLNAGAVGTEGVMAAQGQASGIIGDLQTRKSVLPAGGAYAHVAEQVLAASAGAAAAELRVAQLKAEAKAKNWLPQIGPTVSLSSLGGLVASLTLNQPLIDNGRRKAERDFAAADVQVAAVGLSSAMNQRIYDGLVQYIAAERAGAQAAVSQRAATRLAGFEAAMQARVEGGLSDMSESHVISQRYAEMQATVAADGQTAAAARAQLAALTGGAAPPSGGPSGGLDNLPSLDGGPSALSVLRRQGEGARLLAQTHLARADMLPGLTATADATQTDVNPGLRLTGMGILNAGSGATMQALAETATVVDRQNAEAAETAQRRLVTLSGEIKSLQGRQAQGAKVLAQTEANLELFTEQYKLGRRSLLELVGQYDAFARLERDQVSLRFDIAQRALEMARDRGQLVDGSRL